MITRNTVLFTACLSAPFLALLAIWVVPIIRVRQLGRPLIIRDWRLAGFFGTYGITSLILRLVIPRPDIFRDDPYPWLSYAGPLAALMFAIRFVPVSPGRTIVGLRQEQTEAAVDDILRALGYKFFVFHGIYKVKVPPSMETGELDSAGVRIAERPAMWGNAYQAFVLSGGRWWWKSTTIKPDYDTALTTTIVETLSTRFALQPRKHHRVVDSSVQHLR